jgi:ABC-type amino acid transport substrate-binding protein
MQRLFAGWLFLGCLTVSVGAEHLDVYGDEAYPPLIFVDQGHPAGILVRILQAISARTGDVYDLHLTPWKRAYDAALGGNGALVGVSWTADRAKVFDYSDPIYDDDILVVMRQGREFPFQGLEDLRGRTVGGEIGASYGQAVDQAIAQGLFAVDRDTAPVSRLKKLLSGRFDAALVGNGTEGLEVLLASDPDLQVARGKFVVAPTPLVVDRLHLAFAKVSRKTDALARFNRALSALKKTKDWTNLAP